MVVVHQIDASGAILALARTIVQVFGARSATPTIQASALEPAGRISAGLRINARPEWGGGIRFAFVNVCGRKKDIKLVMVRDDLICRHDLLPN